MLTHPHILSSSFHEQTLQCIQINNTFITSQSQHYIDGLAQDSSNSSALAMELLQSYTKSSLYDGLVQDCSNSSAFAMELLQSCTKPSRWIQHINVKFVKY